GADQGARRVRHGAARGAILGEQSARAGARSRAAHGSRGPRALLPAAVLPLPGLLRGADGARGPAPGPVQRVRGRRLRAGRRGRRVRAQTGMGLNPVHADANDSWRRRVLVLTIVAMAGFAGLLGQLWYLQTLEGGRLQEMSDKNRIRIRRSEEHTSELQSLTNIVCRLLLGKKN